MNPLGRWSIMLLVSAVFVLLVVAFSQWPSFKSVPPGHGELRISMAHRAERREACRPLTEEEREALPPTRRVTEICERGRASSHLKVILNDQVLIDEVIQPSGLHRDGRAYFQSFMPLAAGDHELILMLRDGPAGQPPSVEARHQFRLSAGDALLLAIGDGSAQFRHGTATRTSEDAS